MFKLETVSDYTKEFPKVFSEEEFDHLPERHPWDHAIELTPRFTLVICKIYPLNHENQQVLDEFLAENLQNSHICPFKSPMASLFFFVKKKDSKLCLVQDYYKLNQGTIKNKIISCIVKTTIDTFNRVNIKCFNRYIILCI